MKNHSSHIRLLVFTFFFFGIGLDAYAQIKHFPTIDLGINQVLKHKDLLFVATKSSGLIQIDVKNKSTKVYNKFNSKIGSNDIKSVGIDTDNNIWFTTVLGLSVFKNGAFSVIKPRAKIHEGSDSNDFVFVDTKNNIWLQEEQIVYKIKEDGTILKKLGNMYSQITEAKELTSGVIIVGSYKTNSLYKIENDKLSSTHLRRYQDRLQVNKNAFWLGGTSHLGTRKIENFNIVEKKLHPYSYNYFIDINGHPYRHSKDEKYKIHKLRIPQPEESQRSLNPKYLYEKVIIAPNHEPIITFFFDDKNDLYFFTRLGCYLVKDEGQEVEVITNFNNFIDYPSTEKVLIEVTNQGSFWALYPNRINYFKLDDQLAIDTVLSQVPWISPDFGAQKYLTYFKLLSDSSTMLALDETTIDSLFIAENEIKSIFGGQRSRILPETFHNIYTTTTPFYYKDASTFYIMPFRNIYEISGVRDTSRIISPYYIPDKNKKIRPYGESLYFLTSKNLSIYTKGFFRHVKLPKDEFKSLDGYVTDFEINENGSLFVQIDNRNIWKKDLRSKNAWIRVYPMTKKKMAGPDFTVLLGITKENSLIYQKHDGVYKFTPANEPIEIFSNDLQYFKKVHSFSSNSSHYYLATDTGVFVFPKND